MNLIRKQISKTRTAIDWLQVISEDGGLPEKFWDKKEAIAHIKKYQLQYTSIERVEFRFDRAWVIFKDDSYLGQYNKYFKCKDHHFGWKKTIQWENGNFTTNYYWEKELAIQSIPYDHPTAIAASVYDQNKALVFARKFSNKIT